ANFVDKARTTRMAETMAGLIGEIGRNPELATALRQNLLAPRRAAFIEVLDRARARGELRPELDHDVVVDLFSGPLYNRLLITGAPVTPAVAERLAQLVLRAIAAEPSPAPRRRKRRKSRGPPPASTSATAR